AAARMRLLRPSALLARLEDRLSLLTGGPRDAPARQQTLRRTIAWSHDLLDAGEQALLRRLSVFVGGCAWEDAEAGCHADRDRGPDLLDGIDSLVGKSLLEPAGAADGEPRVWMLEAIREFALERLDESGEQEAIGRRHALRYLALAERAEPELWG